jgi:hypothetical protein
MVDSENPCLVVKPIGMRSPSLLFIGARSAIVIHPNYPWLLYDISSRLIHVAMQITQRFLFVRQARWPEISVDVIAIRWRKIGDQLPSYAISPSCKM